MPLPAYASLPPPPLPPFPNPLSPGPILYKDTWSKMNSAKGTEAKVVGKIHDKHGDSFASMLTEMRQEKELARRRRQAESAAKDASAATVHFRRMQLTQGLKAY